MCVFACVAVSVCLGENTVTRCFTPPLTPPPYLPNTAEPRAALGPFLAMSSPPVRNPLPMEFQGSSLSLNQISEQSNEEYMPPQTPKFPIIYK